MSHGSVRTVLATCMLLLTACGGATEEPTADPAPTEAGSPSEDAAPAPTGDDVAVVARLEADPALSAPGGLDIDSTGRIHVLDAGNDRVVVFAADGGTTVIGEGVLATRGFGGLAVGPDDELYVVDNDNQRVVVFDVDGQVLREIGTDGPPGDGGFATAIGIAVTEDEVLVTDDEEPWVQVFSTDGAYLRRFGGPDALSHATGIAAAPDGTVYVADYSRRSVTAFDPDGEVIGVWRNPGAAGTFGTPEGITVTPDGRVLVTDYRSGSVSVLPDEPGDEQPWETLLDSGAPAEGRLATPVDLAVTPEGDLVVSDQTLDVVIRYRLPAAAD